MQFCAITLHLKEGVYILIMVSQKVCVVESVVLFADENMCVTQPFNLVCIFVVKFGKVRVRGAVH